MSHTLLKTGNTTGLTALLLIVIFLNTNTAKAKAFSLRQMFGGGKKETEENDGNERKSMKDVNDQHPGMSRALGLAADGGADGVVENSAGLAIDKPLPDENMVDVDFDKHRSVESIQSSSSDRDGHRRSQAKGEILGRRGTKPSVGGAAPAEAVTRKRRDVGYSPSATADENGSEASSGRDEGLSGGGLGGERQARASVHDVIEAGSVGEDGNKGRKRTEKEKDKYAGIRKEIEELSHQLGRDNVGSMQNDQLHNDDASHPAHEDIQTHEQTHTLLAHGIEDAIAGLMNVYKALRVLEAGNGMDSDIVARHGPKHLRGVEQDALHEAEVISADVSSRRIREEHKPATSSELHTMPDRHGGYTVGADGKWSTDTAKGATNDHEKLGYRINADSDTTENDGEVKAKTSITALGVLAGVVFFAALGMVVMGYMRLKREQSDAHTQPLYPPRGPSFV